MDNMAELNNNQVENAAHVIAKQLCFWHSCAVSLAHTVTLYGLCLQFYNLQISAYFRRSSLMSKVKSFAKISRSLMIFGLKKN